MILKSSSFSTLQWPATPESHFFGRRPLTGPSWGVLVGFVAVPHKSLSWWTQLHWTIVHPHSGSWVLEFSCVQVDFCSGIISTAGKSTSKMEAYGFIIELPGNFAENHWASYTAGWRGAFSAHMSHEIMNLTSFPNLTKHEQHLKPLCLLLFMTAKRGEANPTETWNTPAYPCTHDLFFKNTSRDRFGIDDWFL